MPPLNHASKALGILVSRRNLFRQSVINSSNSNQIRILSSIAGINALSSAYNTVGPGYRIYDFSNFTNFSNACCFVIQKRWFLGCGDGEEGNMLSKVYEERRVLGYSPEQLYDVVAAVDLYEDFLPWCRSSQIIRRNPDGTFDAELEIGFKFFVESYVSHVELNKPKSIKTTSSQSSLFDHLINIWEFNPGPVPGSCNLHFLVDFKFQSPLYHQSLNNFPDTGVLILTRVSGRFHSTLKLLCRNQTALITVLILSVGMYDLSFERFLLTEYELQFVEKQMEPWKLIFDGKYVLQGGGLSTSWFLQ